MRARLIRIEAGRDEPGAPLEDPTRPAAVGRSLGERLAILPVGPLAATSIGQADLLPSIVPVTTRTRYGLPGREEIANPLHLLTGRLDLAFVVLFLLPLLTLAISYDMISREREGGTLALLLSQPLRIGTLLSAKVLAHAIAVLVPTLAFATIGLLATGLDPGNPRTVLGLATWGVVVVLYTLFWLSVAALVNLFGRSSAEQAVAVAAVWLLLAILVPSAVTTGARVLHPVPSRAALIGAERQAARQAESEGGGLLARYYEDHPELVAGALADLEDFLTRSHAVEEEVDRRMEPVRREFDARVAAQRELLGVLRYFSPVLLAQGALNDIAGTGETRHLRFQTQLERFRNQYHDFFRLRIYGRQRFGAKDVDSIPAWTFEEESSADLVDRVGKALLGIMLPTLVLVGATIAAMRRFSISG
jgi:ABC-2 type transport system permease protein